MSERIDVDVTGKSKFQVAQEMAYTIFTKVEQKSLNSISRQDYLKAVSECMMVLNGGWPYR